MRSVICKGAKVDYKRSMDGANAPRRLRWISVPTPRFAPFARTCSRTQRLFLHYEYVHAEWVKDLFEARLLGAPSQALRELREADRMAMEGVAV